MSWYKRLSLRGRVLLVGSTMTAALIAISLTVQVPYVAESPGVTYDTLGSVEETQMIAFSGPGVPDSVSETFDNPGHLNMTTVSLTDNLPLFGALGLWVSGDNALVPREDHYPPGQSVEQIRERNAQMFRESQSAAEVAALEYLGDYRTVVYVGNIVEGAPSAGKLETQDQLVSINGTKVTDGRSVSDAMSKTRPGDSVRIEVDRGGEQVTADIVLGTHPDDPNRGYLGIEPQQRPSAPFTIDITLDKIGGPSAGLMFTLGIIDKLTEGDLTGGRFIAGSGTIELQADGSSPKIGAIGGILLKLIAARDAGATVFLVPAPNCEEAATRIPDGLQLVRVETLDDAMSAIENLKAGRAVPSC